MTRIVTISAFFLAASVMCAQTTAPHQPASKSTSKTVTTTKKTTTHVSKSKTKSRKHAKPEAAKIETPPPPPPPPPTLAQQPPVPPRVIYQNGLLSIDAPNSTLGDILNGIRRATGATVEGPSNSSDRMIVHLGPGEPRQIVSSLLGSSRYDYIVMGTPQQPNGVNKLVLMARQGGTVAPNPVAASPAPQQQRPPVVANTDEEEDEAPERDDEDAPPSQPVVAQPAPQPAQPPMGQYTGQPQTPQMPPDQVAPPQGQQGQEQQAAPNQPKTPEELYKELQNLERQRQLPQNPDQQQQQQQQPPPQ